MKKHTWRSAAQTGVALVAFAFSGCVGKPPGLSNESRAQVYDRANSHFTNAILLKLRETGPTNTLGFRLAPLLVQEIVGPASAATQPILFFDEGKVVLNDQPHDQITFTWQPPAPPKVTIDQIVTQGVRITLNSSGLPVIWEIMNDVSGAELIFVSQTIEAAALKAFGPPLAGRRFAIEQSLQTAPNTIVARVIEDGPVAMGPIIHLNAGPHNVSTLICRCMTPQVKNLLATETYELRPAVPKSRLNFGKSNEHAAARLTRSLRLPAF